MEQPIKEIIKEITETYKLDDKLNAIRLRESWEKLMGQSIAKHTTKIFITNKTLHINFDSAPLRQELSYAKSKVIKMINEDLGDEVVKDIVFS